VSGVAAGLRARRDSLWSDVRGTVREDLVNSALQVGVAPEGVVIVLYDITERTGRMWMPQGLIPTETLQQVYARAEPLLASFPYPRGIERALFHLRLDPSPQDSLQAGDVVTTCGPEILNETEIRRMVTEFAARQNVGRSRPAHVSALIAQNGQVVYAELARSSGNAELDQFAQQMFARIQFLPGMVNGAPVDMWIVQPVQVR
jgi:TonB family protein